MAPTGLGAAGVGAAALAATAGTLPAHDAVRILVESVLGSGAVVAVSLTVLLLVRHARIGVQIAVAALAPVVAVAVGIVWAASSMFLMGHDLSVLWVVLIGAGTVGMVSALLLGRRVAAASRAVGLLARSLGEQQTTPAGRAGRVPGELAILADELRATSTRLAEAREQAAANERARRELVAWVSHDLRTPLSGIRLMVEALEDDLIDDPETVARYYATMRREADRLSALVDDLFELSSIQARAVRLDRRRIPLEGLVHDVFRAAAPAAEAKGTQLRCAGPEAGAPIWVDVDPAALTRVLRNLVDNAIRHTPAGSVVLLAWGLGRAQAMAGVAVEDGCGGIPPEEWANLFDAGYRGDAARTPGETGSGLGLAIARGLVEAHQGRISVANTDHGCRFEVLLPAAAAAPVPDPAPSPAQ